VVITSQASVPRFAWRTHDEIDWYLLDDDDGDDGTGEGSLGELLDLLAAAGVDEVSTVAVDLDPDELGEWEVVEEDGDVAVLVR
jgi:hypothetical protein